MFKIPTENKQVTQTNESDKDGIIYRTKNIDLSEKGYIKLSDRTRILADSTTLTDLSASALPVMAFGAANSTLYAISNKNIYKSGVVQYSNTVINWTKDAEVDVPTLNASDNDILSVRMRVGSSTTNWVIVANSSGNLYAGSNFNDWETMTLVSGNAYTIAVFENLNSLAYADDDTVSLISLSTGSMTPTITLQLPVGRYQITSMDWANNRLYIGTYSRDTGKALLFEWDGLTTQANTAYNVGAGSVYSVTKYQSGVACVTSMGEIFYCSSGLSKLASFPNFFEKKELSLSRGINAPILRRGVIADGDDLYISVNSHRSRSEEVDGQRQPYNFPSGVWVYNPKTGLNLKHTIGQSSEPVTNAITTGNVNTGTGVITVAGATVPTTGTPCFYYSGATSQGIGGLKSSNRYFVINVSGTTLKLASTYANAIAGTAITLTSTGLDTQFITFNSNADFGGINNKYGGLALIREINPLFTTSSGTISNLLIGGCVQGATSTTSNVTSIHATQKFQENRGVFETPKLESQEIKDMFTSVVTKWKKTLKPEDKIIIKYRTEDNTLRDSYIVSNPTITWVDSTSYTTTEDISGVVIGNEVEIISGAGAGYLAHITNIEESGGTYTVTIDEVIENISANDKAAVIYTNYNKLTAITAMEDIVNSASIGATGSWIQIKIELRGINFKQEELIIGNNEHTPVL